MMYETFARYVRSGESYTQYLVNAKRRGGYVYDSYRNRSYNHGN